jgi:hypothetical protein
MIYHICWCLLSKGFLRYWVVTGQNTRMSSMNFRPQKSIRVYSMGYTIVPSFLCVKQRVLKNIERIVYYYIQCNLTYWPQNQWGSSSNYHQPTYETLQCNERFLWYWENIVWSTEIPTGAKKHAPLLQRGRGILVKIMSKVCFADNTSPHFSYGSLVLDRAQVKFIEVQGEVVDPKKSFLISGV